MYNYQYYYYYGMVTVAVVEVVEVVVCGLTPERPTPSILIQPSLCITTSIYLITF